MDYSMKMVKETYKSQVYCAENKTFINFTLEKRRPFLEIRNLQILNL